MMDFYIIAGALLSFVIGTFFDFIEYKKRKRK